MLLSDNLIAAFNLGSLDAVESLQGLAIRNEERNPNLATAPYPFPFAKHIWQNRQVVEPCLFLYGVDLLTDVVHSPIEAL